MPQHVELERNAGPMILTSRLMALRGAALGGEDVARVRIFLRQGRQHAKLIAADGMDGWLARGRRLASLTGEERFQVRFCREESNREAR